MHEGGSPEASEREQPQPKKRVFEYKCSKIEPDRKYTMTTVHQEMSETQRTNNMALSQDRRQSQEQRTRD